jgi:RimJ/RimL family protein N-acetyltransferase
VQATLQLKALDRAHIDQARAWRNDWTVWQFTRQNDVISDIEQEQWFHRQAADETIRMYAVILFANGHERFIGVAGLTSLDWPNRRAEFSLYIGPEYQRQGHGRMALRVLLDHAFKNLGLKQVWGETFHGNPAIKMFGQLGFQVDGKRREFYFKDGKWLDAYLISILATEWADLNRPKPVSDANDVSAADSPSSSDVPADGRPRRKGRGKAAIIPEADPVPTIVAEGHTL